MTLPETWTDFFLVGYDPELSFFQDSVSGISTRVSSDLIEIVKSDAERLERDYEKSHAHDFRGVIFSNINIRGECRKTVKGLVFICRRFPFPPQSLKELGVSPRLISALLDPKRQPNRLLLIVGRTGSGKSTLGAAFTKDWIRKFGGTGWTIENPVEISLQDEDYGANGACFQVEVPRDDDFGSAIRDTMRSLPRLIFVGELRNGERTEFSTGARAAIQAATTGHLVVATMHANDIASGMQRLSTLCGSSYNDMISDAIGAVLHTRLFDDAMTGKRKFEVVPLIVPNGEKGNDDFGAAIRQHIREGDFHLLSSEVQRQKIQYAASVF